MIDTLIELIPENIWQYNLYLCIGSIVFLYLYFGIIRANIKSKQKTYDSFQHLYNSKFALYLRGFDADERDASIFNNELSNFYVFKKHFEIVKIVDAAKNYTPLGANGLYLKEDWKSNVNILLEHAQIIFLKASVSPGIKWEFEEIVNRNYLYKTIIYLDFDTDEKGNTTKQKFIDLLNKTLDLKIEKFNTLNYSLTIDECKKLHYNLVPQNSFVFKNWKKLYKSIISMKTENLITIVENEYEDHSKEKIILIEEVLNKRGYKIENQDNL